MKQSGANGIAPLYFTGDGAKRDETAILGLGGVDDVINVAGHRIGTMEIESALVDQRNSGGCVVGRAHELKGQASIGVLSF